MSYSAIISKIKVKPHPNADKLQLGEVFDNQVIVGLETKSGDIGVFFPCDGQLSLQFCEANDLVTRYDEQGKKIGGGYFSEKRRVKAQNFRGEKSEGFWMPVRSLEFTGYDLDKLKEGYAFTELNGIEVCTKYITPATLKKGKHSPVRKKNKLFLEHVDTKQFKYDIGKIRHGSVIWVSAKIHGTSARYSYLMDEIPIKWWHGWLNKVRFRFEPKKQFNYLLGTRRVILSESKPDQFYQDEFRFNHFNEIKGRLHKNEIIYGELVGFTSSGQEIMPGVSITKIQDKDLRKQVQDIFGDTVTYHYGCQPGESKFYVYRIIHVNEDGDQIELSWPQVKRRCREAGFETVPDLGMVIFSERGNVVRHGILGKEGLKQYVDALVNEDLQSPLDPNTLNEGVVLRIEDPDGSTYWLKDKGYVFRVLEGIVKEDESYVDIEEQQDIQGDDNV